MTFTVSITGYAGDKHAAPNVSDKWTAEMGQVHAIMHEAVQKMRALGLTVSTAQLNGAPIEHTPTANAGGGAQ